MPNICSDFVDHFKLILEEIPASKKTGTEAKEEHRKRTLDRLRPSDFLVLLDEKGQSYSTVELAEQLTRWELTSRSLVFAVGGADGWCEGIRASVRIVSGASLDWFFRTH